MAHRKCTICGKDIVLVPSAAERARKYGETEKYYLDLFTEHAECVIVTRDKEVRALIKRNGGRG